MEDIQVGEYVRTISGNIFQYQRKDEDGYMWGTGYIGCYLKNILKHSKNIIDLIKVGDYVNGKRVIYVASIENKDDEEELCVFVEETQDCIEAQEIKSIVTKELFESIKYEV